MQLFKVLLLIFQLGHALSKDPSCSEEDVRICKTCTNFQCEVDRGNDIGSFTSVSSSDECQEWCRRRNDYMGDCRFLTYYGKEGHPYQNTCYIFKSCVGKIGCTNCTTEIFDCFCSRSIMPHMESINPLRKLDGIISEGECRQKCRQNTECEFYTFLAESHQCFLLSQLIEPYHNCNGCRTGKANCTESPITTSTTITTTITITPTTSMTAPQLTARLAIAAVMSLTVITITLANLVHMDM